MIAKTRIVQIGNSKGIRVPKMLLDHAQLPDDVELQADTGRLIVRADRGLGQGGPMPPEPCTRGAMINHSMP